MYSPTYELRSLNPVQNLKHGDASCFKNITRLLKMKLCNHEQVPISVTTLPCLSILIRHFSITLFSFAAVAFKADGCI